MVLWKRVTIRIGLFCKWIINPYTGEYDAGNEILCEGKLFIKTRVKFRK